MCNYNFEAQMSAFKRVTEHTPPEESKRILQDIGVLDENGDFTPDYSFLKKG